MSDRRYKMRMVLVAVLVTTANIGLGTRLAFLHLGEHDSLRARIERRRNFARELRAPRGRILDRNGGVLALDLDVQRVLADPQAMIDSGELRSISLRLARVLAQDPEEVYQAIDKPGRHWALLERFATRDVVDRLKQMAIPGLWFEPTALRTYPHENLSCHVVGFANWQGVGGSGIEQRYNSLLQGEAGMRKSEADALGHELYERRSEERPAQAGDNVVLTLDTTIQYMAEQALDRAISNSNAKAGFVIVERVQTGEILAMVSRPDFDPEEFRFADTNQLLNRAVGQVFEPGSTMKACVIAAALNEKVVHPDDWVDCENGYWHYGGYPLRDSHGSDKLTVKDVLKQSSNIGTAKIAMMLGEERLEDYLRAFGFGSRLGIETPGEERGLLYPRSKWNKLSITRLPMGQGVAVTALQMVNAVCAIANDGFLMRPMLVQRVVDAQGRDVQVHQPEVLGRPISQETARRMWDLLARVTEPGGTATRAAMDGYRVAGKTGTAQKPNEHGGYSDTAFMSSFVGFLPADKPEVGMIVVLDQPWPKYYGGTVAAPVFKEISEQIVRYLNIAPVQLADQETQENTF